MKNLLLLAALAALAGCQSEAATSPSGSTTKTTLNASEALKEAMRDDAPAAPPKQQAWTYTENTDPMTSKPTYFAENRSRNTVNFDFPYNDPGNHLFLTVRKDRRGNDVIIRIAHGQFAGRYDGAPVRVRFDDGAPVTFTGLEASDGSSNILFLTPASRFIQKAKKAKEFIVEAEFFQEGVNRFYFPCDSLKWDH